MTIRARRALAGLGSCSAQAHTNYTRYGKGIGGFNGDLGQIDSGRLG